MFIDYLTLIMINVVAGLFILAWFLWKGLDAEDKKPWAAAFFGVGLISFITGLHISFNWPLPGSFNIVFGDTTTLFGLTYLVTAIALWKGWDLFPASLVGLFSGIPALIYGLRIMNMNLTQSPIISGLGFILAGLSAVLSAPFLLWFKNNKTVRVLGILFVLAASAIWFVEFAGASWAHIETFAKWVPATMK
jgi:putative membrane protein